MSPQQIHWEEWLEAQPAVARENVPEELDAEKSLKEESKQGQLSQMFPRDCTMQAVT